MVQNTIHQARVANKFNNFCCGISTVFYGEIENLPEPEGGTIYIVSALVLAAAKEKGRTDACNRSSRLYPKGRIYRIRSRIRKIIIHYNSSK